MKKGICRIMAIGLSLVMTLSLAACGGNSTDSSNVDTSPSSTVVSSETTKDISKDEPVTLSIFAPYTDDDTKIPYDYAIECIKKEFPNVTLELEVAPQDNYTKIKTYASTNMMPDIFVCDNTVLPLLVKSKQILPLDEAIKTAGIMDQFNETAKKSQMTYTDGHIYAIPRSGADVAVLLYNKALFEQHKVKVPTNFDEMVAAIKVFDAAKVLPIALFAKETWIGMQVYDMIATREDPAGIMALDAGKAKPSDPAFANATKKLETLVNVGAFGKGSTNTTYDQAAELFYSGKAAMFINGGWEIPDVDKRSNGNGGIIGYEAFVDAGKEDINKYNISGGGALGGFGVSSNSKNVDIAAKVCLYFSIKYNEARVIKRAQVSTPLVLNATPEIKISDIQKSFMENSSKYTAGSGFEWSMVNAEFTVALGEGIQQLLAGGYKASEFIEDLDKAQADSKK